MCSARFPERVGKAHLPAAPLDHAVGLDDREGVLEAVRLVAHVRCVDENPANFRPPGAENVEQTRSVCPPPCLRHFDWEMAWAGHTSPRRPLHCGLTDRAGVCSHPLKPQQKTNTSIEMYASCAATVRFASACEHAFSWRTHQRGAEPQALVVTCANIEVLSIVCILTPRFGGNLPF